MDHPTLYSRLNPSAEQMGMQTFRSEISLEEGLIEFISNGVSRYTEFYSVLEIQKKTLLCLVGYDEP